MFYLQLSVNILASSNVLYAFLAAISLSSDIASSISEACVRSILAFLLWGVVTRLALLYWIEITFHIENVMGDISKIYILFIGSIFHYRKNRCLLTQLYNGDIYCPRLVYQRLHTRLIILIEI